MRLLYILPAIAVGLCALSWYSRKSTAAATSSTPGRRILYYHDPMHPSYRSSQPGIAPDCNMKLTPVYADDSIPAGILVNAHQAAAIGLQTEAARVEEASGDIRTVGRVEAQESRRFLVAAGADGWIRHIHGAETGSMVAKGQPLASYYSRDVASPQQAYLYALEAQRRFPASSTDSQKELADRQVTQARDYLEFLGLTPVQIAGLANSRREEREVTLGAPASGVVLERNVSEGSRFERGDALWVIGDIESIWITADLFPEDRSAVAGIRTATVSLPGGAELRATVDSSLPRFDNSDRVARFRLRADNRDHRLLPGMTVTVTLARAPMAGLTVPADAVIESGIKPRVFVRRSDGTFEPRPVLTGWRQGGRQQILSGLRSGEEVVTSGAFLLDSESRLR